MQQSRDPAIRLFGQQIPRPGDAADLPTFSGGGSIDIDKEEYSHRDGGDGIGHEPEEEKDQIDNEDQGSENNVTDKEQADPETKNSSTSPETIVNKKTLSGEEETEISKSEQSDAGKSQEKPILKKPDKVLPCPRCNSMDTKFCYYNNYNVNQPRYFCKACQRYWTSGGTMRNVPVGAGRRKNKNSASHYGHITISEALQAARIDATDGTTHLPALKTNSRVLNFGFEGPICDSMASVLNLGDNKVLNQTQTLRVPCKSGENGDDCSSATSSITVSSSMGESNKSTVQQPMLQNNGFVPQLPCIASVPWPYTWNTQVPSGFPYPFYPAYWNCSMPGNWNVPWFPSNSSASNPNSPSSGPNSPTLGKHSRDGDAIEKDSMQNEEPSKQRNGCVLTPKTLRIDDPSEAAKSSIWTTLGIKNESLSGGGMFKAFQSKKDENNHVEASSVLRANPAALSRSLNFHENS